MRAASIALLMLVPSIDDEPLAMTEAVVCESIDGYEDYVARDEPALTKDEKLLIYYRPLHYKIEPYKKSKHRAHLTQDVRIRRKGEKTALWKKDDVVDYEVKVDDPPTRIYLTNTISLKYLKPGEYELDLILKDQVGEGAAARQSVPFRVKPSPEVPEKPKTSDAVPTARRGLRP